MATEETGEMRSGRARRRDAVANRARILEAAVVTLKREGFRVPMATIATDAGVGIGTVYRHFPTREHLMIALTERSFELVLANARNAAANTGSACDAIGAFFETTIKDRDEFVLPWHGGPTVHSERIKNLQSEVWQLIDRVVRRGVDEGSVGSGLTAGDVILFGAMLAQPLPNASEWARVARRQARIYLSGMGAVESDRGRDVPSAPVDVAGRRG